MLGLPSFPEKPLAEPSASLTLLPILLCPFLLANTSAVIPRAPLLSARRGELRAVTDACLDASGAMHACNLAHVLHSVCLCDALLPKKMLGHESARTLGWTHGRLGGAERRTQLFRDLYILTMLYDPLTEERLLSIC